jgi:hypothetical protein
MRGFRILIYGENVRHSIANEEKLLAFYVAVYANGKRQKDAESNAIRMAIDELKNKDGIVPDAATKCSISEVYELKYGYYIDEEVLDFVFFDNQNDTGTSWRGRMWDVIDKWITRMKFRKLGLIRLRKATIDQTFVWLNRS